MSRIAKDLADGAHIAVPNGTHSIMQSLRRASTKVPNIAIVGAGISGLRCADVLLRSGANVTVFEARNRVGGRLHQQESAGHLMDMGPNWIHGTNKNPIMKLAEQTGTSILEPDKGNMVFDADGHRKSAEESSQLSAMIWGMIVDAFRYSDEHTADIDAKTSLYDYFKQHLSSNIKDEQKLRDALNQSRMWGPITGDPIDHQSLKFFFLEECIDGENVIVASTYRRILSAISKSALEADVVNFNTEVTGIHLGDRGVELLTSSSGQYHFDDVIVTCPLGWLKQHHANVFQPALPARLSQAISNISYGRLEKVYITFPTPWWLSAGDTSSYPVFTNFHPPNYLPSPPPTSTTDYSQSVVSLAHLPSPHNHPTLLFYLHGSCATDVVNCISHLTPHSLEYSKTLTSFFEPFYSRLPNYNTRSLACAPSSILATTWQADKFAGNGSYCNFQVGLTHADEDIKCMRDAGGLTHRGLWLAGEHTAPFVALGTTTGAWWSGEGAARRLARKYGLTVPEEVGVGMEGEVKDLEAREGGREEGCCADEWLCTVID